MNRYQKEYIYRINRVIDFIEANIDKELTLEKLSEVANFSPFHFHRIFSAFTGETLNGFIKRKRIERAASILLSEPERPIAEIAYYCGYSSPSVFCRNFKDRFRVSAKNFVAVGIKIARTVNWIARMTSLMNRRWRTFVTSKHKQFGGKR